MFKEQNGNNQVTFILHIKPYFAKIKTQLK
jgi:hypothetical protein